MGVARRTLDLLLGRDGHGDLARSAAPISLQQYLEMFTFAGNTYGFVPTNTMPGDKQEPPAASFEGYVQAAYQQNGVVFACLLVRQLLFSEARFQFRERRSGRPGNLFGSGELAVLERPWPNATTGDLLARMEQDASMAGNFYGVRRGNTIRRLRPDWVAILLGGETDVAGADAVDADVLGYLYYPGGMRSGVEPVPLLPENVCHFAPIPDPLARYRGMSWLTPVIRELMADNAMRDHKLKFLENGAMPGLAVKLDREMTAEQANKWIAMYEEKFGEAQAAAYLNAYKTLFLGPGADVVAISKDFKELSFKETQGAGETRIAAAAGVPPVIVGLSEGLEAATYSNYSQARRRFADGTMRPLWRNAAGSLATIIDVPDGAELWYDDRDIPFLAEDAKDAAEVQQLQSVTIKTLIDAGFDPKTVVEAVNAGDYTRLTHTGLVSVQLQPPGTPAATPANGNGTPVEARAIADYLVALTKEHA